MKSKPFTPMRALSSCDLKPKSVVKYPVVQSSGVFQIPNLKNIYWQYNGTQYLTLLETIIWSDKVGCEIFQKCRIPAETKLKSDIWRTYFKNYWDQQLPDLLQFVFPLDFHRNIVLNSSSANHTSANQFEKDVNMYIKEELDHGAIYGPFEEPLFPVHVSPPMTREKQNSTTRHTIVNLSWPRGPSVNDFVLKCKYLDTYFILPYLSNDPITKKLKDLGPESLLYKVDISRAFRHIIYLFGVLCCFQHCTGHITMGSWKGRVNQYIEFVRVLYCKLLTNSKQLPAFPLVAVAGIEPRHQRWEARVLPLCHRGSRFRHIRIDPGDIDLLGIFLNKLYLDDISCSDPDFLRDAATAML